MTDPIAERIRKTGGVTLRSIGHVARIQQIQDNDAGYVEPLDMLAELCEDNQIMAARLREVHEVLEGVRDIATASLVENWIDEAGTAHLVPVRVRSARRQDGTLNAARKRDAFRPRSIRAHRRHMRSCSDLDD